MQDLLSNPWISVIVIPVVFLILGFWHSNRNKSTTKLSFVELTNLSLFNTFHEKFDTISIEYNNNPINTNLIYYQFSLINNGSNDITQSHIYSPLELVFPSGFKILEVIVKNKTADNIKCKINFDSNKFSIEWDLLKSLESLTFDLILESPEKKKVKNLKDSIQINNRIFSVSKVNRYTITEFGTKTKSNIAIIIETLFYSALAILLSIAFILAPILSTFSPPTISYETSPMSISDNKPVEINYRNDSLLYLTTNNDVILDTFLEKDIEKHVYFKPTIEKTKMNTIVAIGSFALGLFFGIGGIALTIKGYREYNINNLTKKIYTSWQQ